MKKAHEGEDDGEETHGKERVHTGNGEPQAHDDEELVIHTATDVYPSEERSLEGDPTPTQLNLEAEPFVPEAAGREVGSNPDARPFVPATVTHLDGPPVVAVPDTREAAGLSNEQDGLESILLSARQLQGGATTKKSHESRHGKGAT